MFVGLGERTLREEDGKLKKEDRAPVDAACSKRTRGLLDIDKLEPYASLPAIVHESVASKDDALTLCACRYGRWHRERDNPYTESLTNEPRRAQRACAHARRTHMMHVAPRHLLQPTAA